MKAGLLIFGSLGALLTGMYFFGRWQAKKRGYEKDKLMAYLYGVPRRKPRTTTA